MIEHSFSCTNMQTRCDTKATGNKFQETQFYSLWGSIDKTDELKLEKIFLKVEAYPSSVSFRWFFNNSEYQEWKDHGDFTQSGLKSQLEFLPKTSKDYGNLFCIGENAIGMQEEPCSFQIVPTGMIIVILMRNNTKQYRQHRMYTTNCCR